LIASFVAGFVTWAVIGLVVPRLTGEGRFFSVPVGGLEITDRDIVLSVACWTVVWRVILRAARS